MCPLGLAEVDVRGGLGVSACDLGAFMPLGSTVASTARCLANRVELVG